MNLTSERKHFAGDSGNPSEERYEKFISLFARHQNAVLGYILSLLPNWSDAEDVLQQTSIVLWRKFDEFQPGTNFRTWACEVARFKALTLIRERGRDRHVFSPEVIERISAEALVVSDHLEAERHALNGCLTKLGKAERDLITQRYAPKFSVQDFAKTQGKTTNAVYKALNRIRESLLQCVRKSVPLEATL